MPIRQPIISVLAHVDHGKTTLLDYIRGTSVARKEAGGITQHIGASEIPKEVIKEKCSAFLKKWNIQIKIPGLLFIDTPGHEAFTLLRKRGGALADIAILLIDINEGVKPQTVEAIEILKSYKTPFVVAANKIDKIHGWKVFENSCFLESFEKQSERTKAILEEKVYSLIGQLAEHGVYAERFDRIDNFTKTVALIPISAKTGEGIPELLAILTGLVQKYLEKNLEIDEKGMGKGVVLEVKEAPGLGVVADVILYDGMIRKDDILVIGGLEETITTRIKAILKTQPLKEIRMEKKFIQVKEVVAAAGIRIVAPDLEKVIAGAPLRSVRSESEAEKAKEEIKSEIESIDIEKSANGVVVKADTLGSLEALAKMLNERGIKIRKFGVGTVSKKDVVYLEDMDEKNRIVFAFNVKISEEAKEFAKAKGIKIIEGKVIYKLLEDYEKYLEELEEKKKKEIIEGKTLPAKFKFLPDFVFRQSKPAIIGVEILQGRLKQKVDIMNEEGKVIGTVHAIQKMGENVKEALKGERVAVSIDGGFVDRNLKRGEIYYTFIPEEDYKEFMENKDLLKDEEISLLEEIAEIMRKKDKFWGKR